MEFEEEVNKIKTIDDSLQPEVLQSAGQIMENKENINRKDMIQKKKKTLSISEALLLI